MSAVIGVYGAYGHTGRFVVEALAGEGFTPLVAGRDEQRVRELAGALGLDGAVATVDDDAEVDALASRCDALVNCAGPFGATAFPLAGAAIRHGLPYCDFGADPHVLSEMIARLDGEARAAGVPVVPALGFFGALADWLATALCPDGGTVDRIEVAYALSDWVPTDGTLAAAAALGGRRIAYRSGVAETRSGPPTIAEREYGPPFGKQHVVVDYPSPDAVLLPHHLQVADVEALMTAASLRRIMTGETPRRGEVEEAEELFRLEVTASSGDAVHRAVAVGSDIYRITAPILAAAVGAVLGADTRPSGVVTPAQVVEPKAALEMLHAHGVTVTLGDEAWAPSAAPA